MTIKRASRHNNMEKTSTNYESKPVYDRLTKLASSKIWGLFRVTKTLNTLEYHTIHGKFVGVQLQ